MKKIKFSEIEKDFREYIVRSLLKHDWRINAYYDELLEELPFEALLEHLKDRATLYNFAGLTETDDLLSKDSMSMFIDQINEFQDSNDMNMLYLALKDTIMMETKQTISDCFQWMYEDDYFEEEENVWRIFVNNISKVLEDTGLDELKLLSGLSSPTKIIESILNVSEKFIGLVEMHTYNPYIKGAFQMANYVVKFSINSDEVDFYESETWNNYDVQFEVFEADDN